MSVRATGVTIMLAASLLAASDPPVTIDITDYVEMPITGKLDGKGQTDGMLARINSLREEPGGATRFFVNDLNGPLYILDKAPTTPIPTPGPIQREGVLIEWTDTSPSNATFEGTARELMRVPLNTRIHTLADLSFNPSARRGDSEWRVLYIGCGDGGSGEAK